MTGSPRKLEFDDELFESICAAVKPGDAVATLTIKRINRIAAIERAGLYVETGRSDRRGSGAQFVPAWMIVTAWQQLRARGEVSQVEILNELNVKRSAFVCALLAKFPDVEVVSSRPTVLRLARNLAG